MGTGKLKKTIAGLALFFSISAAYATTPAQLDQNKKTVAEFYDLAFNQHKPTEAMQKYVGAEYIQHNPFVGTGKQPFIDFFVEFHKKYPKSRAELKKIFADGNYVTVHIHSTLDPSDRGRAVMDIFRLNEAGKIVEHWDVGQAIPEKSANQNTMF